MISHRIKKYKTFYVLIQIYITDEWKFEKHARNCVETWQGGVLKANFEFFQLLVLT